MRQTRPRTGRTLLLGAAVTTLTLAGHAAASGQAPSALGIGVVALVGTALCATVFRVPRSAAVTAGLIAGLQVLGHALLAVSDHGHGGGLLPTGPMLAFHAAAAIAAALLIGHADELAARWSRLLAPLVSPLLAAAPITPARRLPSTPAPMRRPRSSACVGTDAGRAPPVTH